MNGRFSMKNKLKLLATPLVLFAASTSSYAFNECLVPYLGVDFQIRHIKFKRDFGNHLFKTNNPQGNGYLGLKLNDYLGIEAGYEYSWRRTAHVANTAGIIELGGAAPIQTGQINFSVNSHRLSGPHASLIGFIPFCICDQHFEFFASLGAVHLKVKLKNQPTAFLTPEGFVEVTDNTEAFSILRNTFRKSKTVMKAAAGFNFMMHECAGLKVGIGWENTSKIRMRAQDLERTVKLKDSLLYSVGIFWRFH